MCFRDAEEYVTREKGRALTTTQDRKRLDEGWLRRIETPFGTMETPTHPSGDSHSMVEIRRALGPKGKGSESGMLEYLCPIKVGQPGVLVFHLQLVMVSRVRKHREAW